MDTAWLTATGLLIAVLSLWAQLWAHFGTISHDACMRSRRDAASLGLFWIYTAIAIAVVAFGLLLTNMLSLNLSWRDHIERIAQGFVVTALLMGLANVAESAVSVLCKVWKGGTAFDPAGKAPGFKTRRCRIALATGTTVGLLVFSIAGVYEHWLFVGDVGVSVAALVAYFFCPRLPQCMPKVSPWSLGLQLWGWLSSCTGRSDQRPP